MIAQTATTVRAILSAFSGTLSAGLSNPARRFVAEALYGIMARRSVRLTEIGGALEQSIPLAKTETRLWRNLGRPELREHLEAAVLEQGSRRIGKRTLLILDISDITKPYAKKMECLARVGDGGTGEIAKVSAVCGGHGIWVIDRGGDRAELYSPLLAEERSFIIGQKGDRRILFDRRNVQTAALAAECPMLYATHIVREEKGEEVSYRLAYGLRPGRLREHPDVPLWLVVVRGLGRQPMMLLTNVPMRGKRSVLWSVVSA